MTVAPRPASIDGDQLEALLDALLYSVSHDLRSPLLTISLSAELLNAGGLTDTPGDTGEASTGAVALGAMRQAAVDLERMVQAVTALSRARRRSLEVANAPLSLLLGGHEVRAQDPALVSRHVQVDAAAVRELLDALAGDGPAEVDLLADGPAAVLRLPAPPGAAEVEGSPLAALAGALHTFAGTVVETLAAGEVVLARLGGAIAVRDDEALVWLRLVERGGR